MKILIRKFLPNSLAAMLWGNRPKWGLEINYSDPCWKEWVTTYNDFYNNNQRAGVGQKVNDAGYQIMSTIDLSGKRVLEIGAGDIRHLKYMQGLPKEYVIADISKDMIAMAKTKLKYKNIPCDSILIERNQPLPLEDNSFDVIISFYSLEHLYPLQFYLDDMFRVLKEGGTLVGAIPAEGGLAWGLGRMFTSRRWMKRNTNIDPDKIICWEHPNYGDKIIDILEKVFDRNALNYWPLKWIRLLDFNLVIRFKYTKSFINSNSGGE